MILSSINHKGGTGKSLLAQNLAMAYTQKGFRTCIVDADPSQNSMQWFAGRPDDADKITVFSDTGHRTLRKTVTNCYDNEGYAVVIIDSPPTLEKISTEIIGVSHVVMIPIAPTGGHDMWSTEQIAEQIADIEAKYDKKIPAFFVVNRMQAGYSAHEMFLEALAVHGKTYGIPILRTKIHLRTAYGSSNMSCLTAVEWNDSKAKGEIQKLGDELEKIYDNL